MIKFIKMFIEIYKENKEHDPHMIKLIDIMWLCMTAMLVIIIIIGACNGA